MCIPVAYISITQICETRKYSCADSDILCFTETTNVALNKTAFQSSVHTYGAPSLAVDGNTDGILKRKSCSRTSYEFLPWWAVDLGFATSVFAVEITNRMDCCSGTTVAFVNIVCSLRNTFMKCLHLS